MSSKQNDRGHKFMSGIDELIDLMAKLRDPASGCPWGREQTFSSIAPYTIEEVYEVVDAIERNSMVELKDELGDLLFQIVFYAQIAKEKDLFDFDDVANKIVGKMKNRHPHVFGDLEIKTAEEQTALWEKIKSAERHKGRDSSNKQPHQQSVIGDVPKSLPGLTRAFKLHKKAAQVGFDWDDISGVMEKLDEEINEIQHEIDNGLEHHRMEDEIGDLLFVTTILARHAKVDPETALRHANRKFERRFSRVETLLVEENINISDASLEKMDALWDVAKREEKGKESGSR